MIDTHSHVLPGIDDGARTLDESVEMVRDLASQGVTEVIATPHYINETTFVSPRAQNLKLLKKVQTALDKEKIKVKLHLGNEIYIDKDIAKLIKAKKIATLADSKYILVELPLDQKFPNYADYLRDLVGDGYKVILAHPERYLIVQRDFSIVEELSKAGVLLQCNLGSLTGKYGRKAKKVVKKLAKEKMIFTFGSDIHRVSRTKYVALAQKKLTKYYNEEELKKVLVLNPRKILHSR